MRLLGVLIVLVSLAIPAYWFVQLVPSRDVEALFSQYLGVGGDRCVQSRQFAFVSFEAPGEKVMKDGLVARGMRGRSSHYEEFEIRSDLGLRKVASWLISRGMHRLRPAG